MSKPNVLEDTNLAALSIPSSKEIENNLVEQNKFGV